MAGLTMQQPMATLVPCGDEGRGERRRARVGSLGKQPDREFPLAVPTKGAGDAALPPDEDATEVRSAIPANVYNQFGLERHLVDRKAYKDRRQPHQPSGRCSQARLPHAKFEVRCAARFAFD